MSNPVGVHVGLTVSNLERSVEFYTKYLGFRIAEPGRTVVGGTSISGLEGARGELAFLHNGAIALELVCYPDSARKPHAAPLDQPGCHHLSLAVENLPEMYAALKAKGVVFLGPLGRSARSGAWHAMMRDPDGSIIELTEGGGFRVPPVRI